MWCNLIKRLNINDIFIFGTARIQIEIEIVCQCEMSLEYLSYWSRLEAGLKWFEV